MPPPDMSEMKKDMDMTWTRAMKSEHGGSHHHGKHGKHGKALDRVIAGGSSRIEKGEVVEDVSVLGGKVRRLRRGLGDLA